MVSAVQARREQMAAHAATFKLTMPQARLLRTLERGPARTMASLAKALSCDASNITGLVDRLEARGLIQRSKAEHDRRIKTIVVTRRGAAVIAALTRKTLAPPAALRRLTRKQLTIFHAMIEMTFGITKRARGRSP